MKQSDSILKIAKALLAAQKEIGSAKKDAVNPYYHTNYADLGSVMETCKDALNKQGIVVLQPVMGTIVETILIHESGEFFISETPIVTVADRDPQKLGSAITYARRYGLQSMVFIPAEDDDGNTASGVKTEKEAPKRAYYSNKDQKVVNPAETPGVQKGSEMKATEKQVKLIAILLQKKGQRDEDLKTKYNVASKKDLTIVQASAIIDNLNKLPDVEQQQ